MHVKFPSLKTDQISDPSYEEAKQVNKEQEAHSFPQPICSPI